MILGSERVIEVYPPTYPAAVRVLDHTQLSSRASFALYIHRLRRCVCTTHKQVGHDRT
jgi:hypothetical protein